MRLRAAWIPFLLAGDMADTTAGKPNGGQRPAGNLPFGAERGTEDCLDSLKEVVEHTPGVIGAEVDRPEGEVRVEFDCDRLSETEVRAMAENLSEKLRAVAAKCTFRLSGRGCEACADRLAYRLESAPGIHRATASYIGGALTVNYDRDATNPQGVLEQARTTGLDAKPLDEALKQRDAARAAARASAGGFVRYWLTGERLEAVFCALTLGCMIAGWVTKHLNAGEAIYNGLYLLAYLFGGYFGTLAAWESLRQKVMDIDLLMVLAALGAAYVGAPFEGAMLLFLFSFSNVLQAFAMEKTRGAIEALAQMRPTSAHVMRNGQLVEVPIDQIDRGARYILRPGDRIPLDGTVAEGESTVDQSSVTGESMPINKKPGDEIFAGTINQMGSLTVAVTKKAEDSTIARLIQLVEEAQSSKASTQRFLDTAEQYYAIGVIVLTVALGFLLPTLFKVPLDEALYRAITVMVVASPCALVISTPASILSAIANGARRGILFKGGAYVEAASSIRVVTFDKTGTLTLGEPRVTDVISLCELPAEDLLAGVASVEEKSEHPLAQAIVEHARGQGLKWAECTSFHAFAGKGAWAVVGKDRIAVGSPKWMNAFKCEKCAVTQGRIRALQEAGKTAVVVAHLADDQETADVIGLIGIADQLRPEAAGVIRELKAAGVRRVVMLTGDSERVARAVAQQAGVDEYYADLLPEDKVRLMRKLAQGEHVAMVGDGTNDAPALATATVGIAMGAAGSDVALESADIVLMANELEKIPYTIALSHATKRIMVQNLSFAAGVIVVMVLATLFLPVVGLEVPLPLGVFAHEGGTVLVCLNGLRLLGFKQKLL